MKLLSMVNSPTDLKKLSEESLVEYSKEAREFIVSTVNNCGGHLASNLGAVELTVALHYVFDCPNDSILFDTGHQSYMHKIITGRRDDFSYLRTDNGVSGFQSSKESDYDAYTSGHSGNSLSVGVGIARANKLLNKQSKVVSVIGDGAFTAGMAFEALNDIGASNDDMIIVLNDNKMSISKNVGAMSKYLTKLRISRNYPTLKFVARRALQTVPFVGDRLVKFAEKVKKLLKNAVNADKIFENFGVKYYGPFDGHDVKNLIKIFSALKNKNGPILIHLITDKGKGYAYAEENPTKYHGVTPKREIGKQIAFSEVLGRKLTSLAENDQKIVAITAAMAEGTGLSDFSKTYPSRFFDVGIAEAHAVSMCAGLARKGLKPVFAVYSSFLQRGFDQILTDVCIDNLPVVFAIDHSGFVSGDGPTHQGVYDTAYLSLIPNLTVVTPINAEHLGRLLEYAISLNSPVAIKYPKTYDAICDQIKIGELAENKWDFLAQNNAKNLIVVTNANMIDLALSVPDSDVVFTTFVSSVDKEALEKNPYDKIIILEDGVASGGTYEKVASYLKSVNSSSRVYSLSHGNRLVGEYERANAMFASQITADNINKIIFER